MKIGNHDEGFEREVKLKQLYIKAREAQEALYQWADFMEVARLVNPELCDGVFERRPCIRRLRYIGYDNWPEPIRSELNADAHTYFIHGEIYYSTDFNGATYSIKGYSDSGKVIGCSYFEWITDEAEDYAGKVNHPHDFALLASKYIREKPVNETGYYCCDRTLQRIALEYARKGDFKRAFVLGNEIESNFWLIRSLMEIASEMLMAGEKEAALKTMELAWKNSREQVEGFPEADLFKYLELIRSNGHDELVHSILEFALARAEFMDDGEFRLNCYCRMLPYLAVHWREKAEELIEHILALSSGIPGTRDEELTPGAETLIDIALTISRYDLDWTEKRSSSFLNKLTSMIHTTR